MSIQTIKTKLIPIHNISMKSALVRINAMSRTKGLDIIVTPNIDHLVRVCENDVNGTLKYIYNDASLCLCDSKILEKLLRLKGKKVKEVIPGSTLTQNLFDAVLTKDDNVMIVGGNEDVIEKLRSLYQHLTIHHHNPPMGFIYNNEAVNKVINIIKNHQPNYIFLAVGSPRQEILAKKLKDSASLNGTALCIGASILFMVGDEKRAPLWLQKMHLEWFYRLVSDPRRLFRRYASNLLSLPKLFTNL